MKLKRFSAIGSALILALASLFTLAFSGEAQAAGTTLYWCDFSSNSDFNTASNWNTDSDCNSGTNEVPVSGDALVFDNSALNSGIDINNDISGLDISSITFQGNGSADYDITGDAISLDDGISDTSTTGLTSTVGVDATLTAGQTFSVSGTDSIDVSGNINLGTNNLDLAAAASQYLFISGTISGSGGLTFDSPGSGVANYKLTGADTSLSGPITIDQGAAVIDDSGSLNALGTGLVTINSGGDLRLIDSSSNTATFTNPLNIDGDGVGGDDIGAIISCLDTGSGCTGDGNTTLTLSGNVTLSGDTDVVNGAYSNVSSPPTNTATFDFTGDITYNGFTLSAASDSSTTVNLPAAGTSGSVNAPKTPDTGTALASDHSGEAILGAILLAISCVISATVFRKINRSTKS